MARFYRVIKKISVHLTITLQSWCAQRLFDHPVEECVYVGRILVSCAKVDAVKLTALVLCISLLISV